MKIDSTLVNHLNQTSGTAKQGHSEFEHWLNTPAKDATGDEYYWQHQQHLQNSELHFQHKEQNPKQQALELAQTNSSSSPMGIEEKIVELTKPKNNSTFTKQEEQSSALLPEFKLFISKLLDKLESNNLVLKTELISVKDPEQETSPQYLTRPSLTQKPEVKNHQLFINDKEAELSLNTSQLEPQHNKELIKLVKSWFRQKGFYLQKFIVNGVKQ